MMVVNFCPIERYHIDGIVLSQFIWNFANTWQNTRDILNCRVETSERSVPMNSKEVKATSLCHPAGTSVYQISIEFGPYFIDYLPPQSAILSESIIYPFIIREGMSVDVLIFT